jgi:gliding motility-associated-like protein
LYTPNSQIPGTYPIKYFYSTYFGCADSATKPITVWPSPVAKWGVNAILCEKNNIQFTDSSVANYSNIVQRYWDFGDGTNTLYTNTASFTKKYAVGNTYAASLRVITDSGCRSTYNIQNLKLNFLPVVNFTLPSICLPDGRGVFKDISTIKDNSEGLFTYLWKFGDPNDPSASTLKQPTHQYTALGPVNVQLKVTSKDLCVDSLTQILSAIYPQPKADFATNPSEICLNDQINFIDNTNGKTSAINTWFWDLANGTSSGAQNPSKQFTDSGSFQISLYAYNQQGCVSDTMVKTVIVHPYPKLVLGPNLVVLEFGMTAIKPKYVYGTALSYLWTPATDLSSDTAMVPICKPQADITYKLTLTGIGNCSVTDTIFVKVLLAPLVPNVFSPNGDGINDTWKIQYLESYPGATIDVFNRYGQKVFSSLGYDKEWDGTYNGNPLPVGTYYYIVNPKNGRALISGSVTIIK